MGSMLKKIFVTVAGSVATAYLTKYVTEALDRKPLKTRVREGKEKVVQLKDTAMEKASNLKSSAQSKVADVKVAAQSKAEELKVKADSLIEERNDKDGSL